LLRLVALVRTDVSVWLLQDPHGVTTQKTPFFKVLYDIQKRSQGCQAPWARIPYLLAVPHSASFSILHHSDTRIMKCFVGSVLDTTSGVCIVGFHGNLWLICKLFVSAYDFFFGGVRIVDCVFSTRNGSSESDLSLPLLHKPTCATGRSWRPTWSST
jgi:hypothetical protein